MVRHVVFNWPVSSVHGWGVYGLNLALAWASDPDMAAASAGSIDKRLILVDPLQWRALEDFRARSANLMRQVTARKGEDLTLNAAVMSGLGNMLAPEPGPQGGALRGHPFLGVAFFERDDLGPAERAALGAFDSVIAGSAWNAEILRAHGAPRVELVLQGVDTASFHPAPARGLLPGRFLVFSGGKLELRKGQDNVLAAWRIFAARHPDAMLVAAWSTRWPDHARTVDGSRRAAPLPMTDGGTPDLPRWAAANGIRPGQFLALDALPNALMPGILREMDAALFPNRCEGGTNLVAMECMACGVPTILSANTGHLDLLAQGGALALADQRRIRNLPGWRESDIDEIVAALETLYTDRARAAEIGAAGARFMRDLTWARCAAGLKSVLAAL
jgi:glycosyltransferase involved in cell wall biosynthesis